VPESRGESVYLAESDDFYIALVTEGLGTENMIAEEILPNDPNGWGYSVISHNNLSTIQNDLVASGADPIILNQFISVGSPGWFSHDRARGRFINVWAHGCIAAGAAWGGGETQELRDVVSPGTAVLAGAGVGIIRPKTRRIKGDVQDGDIIFLTQSNGIHTNGLTMARDVAATLPDRYFTKMRNGEAYAMGLLQPAVMIYPLVKAALDAKIRLHYVTNITGHGWRKIMRLEKDFSYIIEKLPVPQAVFRFIQEISGATDKTMYGTFNMNAGCGWMVHQDDAPEFGVVAKDLGYNALKAGRVERGPRAVFLPNGVSFDSREYTAR
jgi:phosphoribosylformylglycinamidine cyclo-ligase